MPTTPARRSGRGGPAPHAQPDGPRRRPWSKNDVSIKRSQESPTAPPGSPGGCQATVTPTTANPTTTGPTKARWPRSRPSRPSSARRDQARSVPSPASCCTCRKRNCASSTPIPPPEGGARWTQRPEMRSLLQLAYSSHDKAVAVLFGRLAVELHRVALRQGAVADCLNGAEVHPDIVGHCRRGDDAPAVIVPPEPDRSLYHHLTVSLPGACLSGRDRGGCLAYRRPMQLPSDGRTVSGGGGVGRRSESRRRAGRVLPAGGSVRRRWVSPVPDIGVAAVGQLPRVADVFDGEGHPGGHGDQRPRRVVGVVVVGAKRRADGAGGPVQRDDGEQLVAAEPALEVAVAVAPGPVLVDDPGGQPRRGVGERCGQGVGPGGLDGAVAAVGFVPTSRRSR